MGTVSSYISRRRLVMFDKDRLCHCVKHNKTCDSGIMHLGRIASSGMLCQDPCGNPPQPPLT
eukprot:2659255-Alexandrium_andersonii.AAC.1